MKYVATAHQEADGRWYACVESDGKRSRGMDLALRHARAMKAVLLAARAWARAATALEVAYERDERVTKRLLDAAVNSLTIERGSKVVSHE